MSKIKMAEKSDWKTEEMPQERDSFVLKLNFTEEQMQKLRYGNIPTEMEDKWFWYMEGNTLFAYRSWTGFCIYIIEFSSEGLHTVTVNRNREQYKRTDIEKETKVLNELLDWWSGTL